MSKLSIKKMSKVWKYQDSKILLKIVKKKIKFVKMSKFLKTNIIMTKKSLTFFVIMIYVLSIRWYFFSQYDNFFNQYDNIILTKKVIYWPTEITILSKNFFYQSPTDEEVRSLTADAEPGNATPEPRWWWWGSWGW